MSSSSGSNSVGDAEAVPNIPLYEGHETDYIITSLIQDSLKLKTRDIHRLLINHEMPISLEVPHRPQPPALFMVPNQLVLDGIADGYTWRKKKNVPLKVDGEYVIDEVYHENTTEFDRKMFRRIYCLINGQGDQYSLVHYHHPRLNNK